MLLAFAQFALVLSGCAGKEDVANAGGSAGTSGNAGEGAISGAGPVSSDTAQWPMPNSAGLGLPNPANYDVEATPGVVHDLVTDLYWLQNPGLELYTRADAIGRCAELSFAGADDWRVPEFIELISLFDVVPNEADPTDPIYIAPAFQAEGRFWSRTPVSANGLGRLLDFTAAGCGTSQLCSIGVLAQADSPLGGAFCVRNNEPPSNSARYESNGGKVTDLRTGLTWQGVSADAQTVGYADAVSACEALGNGARLPSINELLSILVPLLDKNAFPNWPAEALGWSNSLIPAKPGTYWAAAIGGATKAELATNHNRVECVR
jgi:hypothetical protein